MNYFTVFMDVLLRPSEFFKKMPREENLLHASIFSIIFLLLTVLIGDFFETVYIGTYFTIPGTILIKEVFAIFTVFLLIATGNILSFTLLGAEGRYQDTFVIFAYSTAVMPLEFLPIFPINIILSIYWLHICVRGGQFIHNLSYWKSCSIVLIGTFVFPILLAVLIF